VWKRGRTPQIAGFGARDPQLADKIECILEVGVSYGVPTEGPFGKHYRATQCKFLDSSAVWHPWVMKDSIMGCIGGMPWEIVETVGATLVDFPARAGPCWVRNPGKFRHPLIPGVSPPQVLTEPCFVGMFLRIQTIVGR
jgi:hypothetical protein